MREEYEDRGFNPIRFGVILAIVIAAGVGSVLGWRAYTENKAMQAARQQQIEKFQKENDLLKQKVEKLIEDSKEAADKLKKQLQQRETLLTSVKQEKETESRNASSQITQLKKEKTDLETKLAQVKKDSDQEVKKLQDQLNKGQMDLQRVRADADRYAKNYNTLKAKVDKISEGDQAAADRIVQELAETRQELKKEQSLRKKLEEELEALRQQTSPPQQ